MQVIIQVELTVEQYVEEQFQRRVRAPERCGNCGALATLSVLAYYSRYTTGAKGGPVKFWVARFICEACKLTTSCLPSFAQPYRLVASETVEAFMYDDTARLDVQRNEGLLKCYFRRFKQWQKTLHSLVGNRFGRGPPAESATAFLRRAVAACGSLAELTLRLVQEFKATCFGTYGCHQPSYPH